MVDNERIKEILTKPIYVVLVLLITIVSLVTFAVVNNISTEKTTLVSSLDIDEITTDEKTGKLIAKLVDYKEKQENEYIELKKVLANAANPEKSITDNISKYINARYNYDEGAKNNKDNVLNIIDDFATNDFKDYVSESLDKEKEKKSKAEILKFYINGRKFEMLNSSTNELLYVYVIDINGEQQVFQINVKSEGGVWKLKSQEKIGELSEGVK